MGVSKRLKISSLNTHLLCPLCQGYYVEATAIVECLHTFCRSCIVKYLRTNSFCPICDVQIQKSKPWSSLRADKILQDLVYKLVPGLYQNEMRRRRQFYSRLGSEADVGEGEEKGYLPDGARFFSQDDSISLSLEYYSGQDEKEEEEDCEGSEGKEKENSPVNQKIKNSKEKPKRYLQCPAAVTVRHLKKFLRMKYGIGLDCWVDIIYNDECLPEDFTLIDVAYTFTWKRTSPMRFSYRIFSKTATKAIKSQKSFQKFRADEKEEKSKHQSNLEQQMQSEYLGNFNLNPTNSGLRKTQNCRNKSNFNNNNKNNSVNTTNGSSLKKCKKDEYVFKASPDSDEGSRDQTINLSEDSSASTRLKIFSEKEESLKENSEDSQELTLREIKNQKRTSSVTNFEEEAVDSFTASKLLKNKRKSEGKKEKRRIEMGRGEKRRKSAGHAEEYVQKDRRMIAKRRKTVADEFSLKREAEKRISENFSDFPEEEEIESIGKLKNEALRKVFVTKEKPDVVIKRNNFEVRKKKRKKSKHHESDAKKRKLGVIPTSPSIMSIAKDALKLKVKLTPNKPVIQPPVEENNKKDVEEEDSDKNKKNFEESDSKKMVTDKERLSHLRAVRKNINKNSSKEYISAPSSLIISKVDSSEQQPVKSSLVDPRPSLEIMLVNPSDNTKTKPVEINTEVQKEEKPKKVESPAREKSEVVDNFGVLDLSEKSTRKQSSANSSPVKEATEPVEKTRKSSHQSILQIAQTLVNRKMSPILSATGGGGFDGTADSTATAMRNLQTLSDTAVNILMAAQSKSFAAESQKRPFVPSVSPPAHKPFPQPLPNSTKPLKDCENGSGLKIPMYSLSPKRTTPIPPVPNLHEIYPRGRGRSLPFGKPSTPIIKPGQNQTVRQIPNPFAVLNRQANQNAMKVLPPGMKSPMVLENGEDTNSKPKYNSIPPLQSIKAKQTIPKLDDLSELSPGKNSMNDLKAIVPKIMNNNTKSVQNGSEINFFGMKNGEEKKSYKYNNSSSIRKIENMAKNIESVAAGLTARAVSNSMIDAK